MALSELEIKQQIILAVLDFSTHIDRYTAEEVSDKEKRELMSLALSINNLINNLSQPLQDIAKYNNGKYVAPKHNNYLRVKRSAELVFY